MTGDGEAESTLERRVKLFASILAPTTVLTALLFYFGYVRTAAEYGYFGISMGSAGFSSSDLLLNSVGALYVPLGVLLLVIVAGLWAHAALSRSRPRRARVVRNVAVALVLVGAALMVRGIVGVAVPSVARDEAIAVTPLCLGLGVSALAYGRHLLVRGEGTWTETAGLVAVCGVVVLSLFWTANSFAAAYGRGQAEARARSLTDLPEVVVDARDRLFVTYPGLAEFAIPGEQQVFRYRYRGLRLLLESNGRLFLVPEQWQRESGAVLVLPADASVRLQFRQTP